VALDLDLTLAVGISFLTKYNTLTLEPGSESLVYYGMHRIFYHALSVLYNTSPIAMAPFPVPSTSINR
jgi:hypothetical protein